MMTALSFDTPDVALRAEAAGLVLVAAVDADDWYVAHLRELGQRRYVVVACDIAKDVLEMPLEVRRAIQTDHANTAQSRANIRREMRHRERREVRSARKADQQNFRAVPPLAVHTRDRADGAADVVG